MLPKRLQGEELGGVVGVLEDVRGRLIDRHRPRAGRRVGALAGVHRQRVEPEDVVVLGPRLRDSRRHRSLSGNVLTVACSCATPL